MPESLLAGEPGPLGTYSDASRRLTDAHNLALAVHGRSAIGRFIACRMSDGTSDGTLYDTLTDAKRHQLHETQCAYVCIQEAPMPYKEGAAYLAYVRGVYDAGYRMPDVDSGGGEIELVPTYLFRS